MKVIELLTKIANGEYPTVKYRDVKYEYDDTYGDYIVDGEKGAFGLLRGWSLSMILNDEVEIIEEDKKIEKIETYDEDGNIYIDEQCFKYVPIDKYCLTDNEKVFVDKINKIIDYINKEKE